MQTRQQRFAQCAVNKVQNFLSDPNRNNTDQNKAEQNDVAQRYRSLARRFPALIHDCGLAQGIAFLQSKGQKKGDGSNQNEYGYYLDHLKAVMALDDRDAIHEVKLPEYLRLSRDARQAAGWLKRYAEALIADKGEINDTGAA